MKKRLTASEEFEIMKLVLDKFLWLGFAIMGVGLWKMVVNSDMGQGVMFMIIGIVVLVLFVILIVKEYEIIG
ncbi:MAG: hypothetical protein V1740_04080 [Candidatus Woesearchaeota archaeon]